MKTNRFLTMLCAAILMSAFNFGCKEPEIERMASRYFIPYSITTDTRYSNMLLLEFDDLKRFSPTEGNSDDKERYKQYLYYFGDFGVKKDNGTPWFDDDDDDPEIASVCVCNIKSIDVVCNQYFNQSHTANKSVNDIITIIPRSGYIYMKGINTDDQYKKFDLLNVDKDYFKLNPITFAGISFNQEPDQAGEYEFTITVTMDADPVSGDTPTIAPIKTTIKFNN